MRKLPPFVMFAEELVPMLPGESVHAYGRRLEGMGYHPAGVTRVGDLCLMVMVRPECWVPREQRSQGARQGHESPPAEQVMYRREERCFDLGGPDSSSAGPPRIGPNNVTSPDYDPRLAKGAAWTPRWRPAPGPGVSTKKN